MAPTPPTAKLLFLDTEIDTSQETVRRGGEEYRLRPQTFQVLLHLIRNRDRVVTREELFASVWKDVAVTEDALVQCVVEIRKALGDEPRSPRFIRTVPKRGYCFIAPPSDLDELVVSEPAPVAPIRFWRQLGVAATALVAVSLMAVTFSKFDHAVAPPPEKPTSSLTASPEAYRLYSLGVERANELQTREAIDLLERALLLDPEFAMAHARIGYTRGVTGGEAAAARPYLQRAIQLGHRLHDKDRMMIEGWQAIIDSDFDGAIERFRAIVDRYPTDLESHWRLGQLLNGEQRIEEAVAVLERAVLIDPRSPQVLNFLGGLYSSLGRHKEAIAVRKRYVAVTDEPNAWDSLGLSFNWAGEYGDALTAYGRAIERKADFDLAFYHRAATYAQLGRFSDALADVESCLARAANDRERSRAFAAIAQIHTLRGDEQRAREAARRISDESGWLPSVAEIGAPRSRSVETMVRTVAAFNDRGARANRRNEFHTQGYEALRRGDAEGAIGLLRDSLRFRPIIWSIDSLETGLAGAWLQLGRAAEAREEYTRVLAINQNYARALYGRARANESLGRNAEARDDYRRFLTLWEHADADAHDLIDAKARVARLQ
ncbi:MAG TPA: tetratricopeptide repeat protein [Thermoanaerobaculia bacterium]|nr:tetratricopeptide repeat protein [Thermoanaerobaculia bacterium]